MSDEFKAEATFDNKAVQDFINNLNRRTVFMKEGNKKYVSLISATVFQDVMDHFSKEEGSDGPWQMWTIGYARQMNMKGKSGNKVLQDSGRLRNAFAPTKWKNDQGAIYWYNNAKTKTGFPYAAAHDEGGPQLPQRDFMWLSSRALENIAERTLQFIMEENV